MNGTWRYGQALVVTDPHRVSDPARLQDVARLGIPRMTRDVGRTMIVLGIGLALLATGFAGWAARIAAPRPVHVLPVWGAGVALGALILIGGRALLREFRRDTLAWYLEHPAECRVQPGTLEKPWFEQRWASSGQGGADYIWLLHLRGTTNAHRGTVTETIRLPLAAAFASLNLDDSGPRAGHQSVSRAWFLTDDRPDSRSRIVGVPADVLDPLIANVEVAARSVQRLRRTFWKWATVVLVMLGLVVLALSAKC